MRSSVVVAVVVLFGSVAVGGVVAGATDNSTAPRYGSVSAASIVVDAEEEQRYLEEMQSLADRFGLETKGNAFILTDGDKTWVVFTDATPKTGTATVEGTIALEATADQRGAIFADSVSFSQDGEQADFDDVKTNPENFDGQLVEVTANSRQLAYASDGGKAGVQLGMGGRLGGETGSLLSPPGEAGRWAVRNISASDNRWRTAHRRAGGSGGTVVTVSNGATRWWVDARTTVDAVVLNYQGTAVLYVANTVVSGTSVNSVSDISDRGGELEGEVVTVESQVVGSRISSQELLLSVAKCAPESVAFPPTGCIPVPVDATVHTGVLFDEVPESSNDVVFYAGVSNRHQKQVLTSERGTYRVTGRVVSTDQIDPDFPDGYALVVYDMKRTGGLQVGESAEDAAQTYADESESEMREQINGSQLETNPDATGSGQQQSTSTATAAPAQLQIVASELVATEIALGESVAVSVTVENSGGQTGETELVLRMDGSVVTREVVLVRAGRSETVYLGVEPESVGEYELSVSGESVGVLQVTEPQQEDGPLLTEQEEELLGLAGAIAGAVLFLSAFVLQFLRAVKEWRQGAVETGDGPAIGLFAVSGVIWLGCGLGLESSASVVNISAGIIALVFIWIIVVLKLGFSGLKAVYDSL